MNIELQYATYIISLKGNQLQRLTRFNIWRYKDMFDNEDFMTVETGAKYAQMGLTTFRKLVNSENCTFAKRIGRRIIISKRKLVEFLNDTDTVAI